MTRQIALGAALLGALLLAWAGTRTPAPAGADAAATAFSTDRALADIGEISKAPHPVGSVDHARVRDYVLGRMTQLGLSPTVQMSETAETRSFGGDTYVIGGQVENLIGILPGRDRTLPALALMAHYDSVPGSPGAADDATGVAAVLETVRAIKAGGVAQRDIIVLITDGEEAGLLGARAFFAEHPLRKRIGLMINLEARGNGGRANMFQTGPDNGAIVAAFAKSASAPISNSLAVFLYENMPNDTDFSVSKAAGLSGLNFAFIGRQFDYHAATATLANLDKGSVQHIGDQTLAATRRFSGIDLPGKAPDAVYSQTFGDHILAYPAWVGWLLWLATAAAITACVRRIRTPGEPWPWTGMARGAGAAVLLLTGAALALHTARRVTGVAFGFLEQRPLLAQWGLWETTLAIIAVGMLLLIPAMLGRGERRWPPIVSALAGGILCQLFGGWDLVGGGLAVVTAGLAGAVFGKPVRIEQAWAGVLVVGVILSLALQALQPTVAVIIAWPLALAAVAALATDLGRTLSLGRIIPLALLAALSGGWLAVYFHGVAQGLDLPAILGLFVLLGALVAWPLAARDGHRALWPALAVLAVGIVLTGVVRFREPWTERQPMVTSVFHVSDTATGKAWRIATTPELDPWSRAVLTAEGGAVARRDFQPFLRRDAWAAPARGVTAAAPLSVSRGPDGSVVVEGDARGRLVMIDIESGPVASVVVNGRTVALKRSTGPVSATPAATVWTRLRWQGDPGPIRLVVPEPGPVEVRYAIVSEGWPQGTKPLPSRPKTLMPFDVSDSTVLTGAATLP
jgi:hypothetical protein